jgi:hypothetical protein
MIYCPLLGMYGEDGNRRRNGLAVTAGARCNDASIPRDPAGRPPELRPRCLSLHIRPMGIRSRFADRRLSVFVIVGPCPNEEARQLGRPDNS